jgi:hypothetical protein
MGRRSIAVLLLVTLLLTACSGGGPSNSEAEEIIYGVYIRDASVVGKEQCELTTWMEEAGETNVWLVLYRFEGQDEVGGMLLSESEGEWNIYLPNVDSCPR